MSITLSSVYLGNIDYYTIINQNPEIIIDVKEHFQKQSYRNRSVIHGANGALNLIIPLAKRGIRTKMEAVKIDNSQRWQNLHWRSIQSAYRSSPYFEYYEDEILPFYEEKYEVLVEFNEAIQNKIVELLDLDSQFLKTESYQKIATNDFRDLIHPKKEATSNYQEEEYTQVFSDRNGFIPNLSILDLLFNEGPNAINFLG
ncbi:MAG: WbqC family protein [Flavobacteriales bacterium]|jgi:hypothetical protein|nr:WbqC family protein [Flavobacteriales bacterium]